METLSVTHANLNINQKVRQYIVVNFNKFNLSLLSSVFGSNEVEYKIIFNTYEPKSVKVKQEKDDEEGPAIERLCKNCGHNKMTYAALQLRSADEGQTVFFTCVKCKFKESENS